MNDCPNAETRDRLPDLLNDWLEPSARAVLMEHVEECVDCREELDLLRDVRGVLMARTPSVDVAAVVKALPRAPIQSSATPAPDVVRIASRRRVWADWRVAAAVTLLIAGGSSVALYNSSSTSGVDSVAVPAIPVTNPATSAAAPTNSAATGAASSTVAATDEQPTTADAGTDSRFGDLDEQQLQSLLGEIKGLRAVPLTDPEPVRLDVTGTTSSETL